MCRQLTPFPLYLPIIATALATGSCQDPDSIATTQAIMVVDPAFDEEGFFALPYPNQLRQGETLSLSGLVAPNSLFSDYFDAIESEQEGFGISTGLYARFSGPLDPSSLPTASEELRAGRSSSVYLVNIEEGSLSFAERVPLSCRFFASGGELIGDNWLSCHPFPGFTMAPGSLYAWVMTERLLDKEGHAIGKRKISFA